MTPREARKAELIKIVERQRAERQAKHPYGCLCGHGEWCEACARSDSPEALELMRLMTRRDWEASVKVSIEETDADRRYKRMATSLAMALRNKDRA